MMQGSISTIAIQLAHWAGLKVFASASRAETVEWCKNLGADTILNHRNSLYEELKAAGTDSVDAIFCTTQMERHWEVMSECIRPQGRIVFIDDPVNSLDGLTPENIQAMRIKQESGTMMGKQVLVL